MLFLLYKQAYHNGELMPEEKEKPVVAAAPVPPATAEKPPDEASEGVDEGVDGAQGGIVAGPGWSEAGVPSWPMLLTSRSSSLGRESASATTLAFPSR